MPEADATCSKCGKAKDGPSPSYCRDCMRFYQRERSYGISREQFMEMLEQQNHQCAICGDRVGISSNVDHDHATNKVRGILCHACNSGLGKLGDNIDGLFRALIYLAQA